MKKRWYCWPLAWLYGMIIAIRNALFDSRWLPSKAFKTAVISVGNITVGGTGKTPHVEYIIGVLQSFFKVAMISRGYKRKSHGMQVASIDSNSSQLGDEPYQIYRKFPNAIVIAEANRCKAIDYIEKEFPSTDVVVLDDAFQHRYVDPGLSVLLIDYNRLITNDALLPVGTLREPAAARYRATVIVITKCPSNLTPIELRYLYNEVAPRPYQRLFFSYYKYGELQAVFGKHRKQLTSDMSVLLVSGIAQPQGLVEYVSSKVAHVSVLTYKDHHHYTTSDWLTIQAKFNQLAGDNRCVIVTDKDAAKIVGQENIPTSLCDVIWSLPIQVCFMQDKEREFNQLIIDYVSNNKRNGCFFGS
ncbi:MAG: tetraacyldisaccharide 4'-kinase [Paludibacteraceae bacterium]|nr:tetraacyldisaccharide 4'-kinase [Paludibacteraceae bacterium]